MAKYMRSLHRDIGFLLIGLTLLYTITGLLLIYRGTSFLKTEKSYEKTIATNLKTYEIGDALHERKLKPVKEDGDIVYFKIKKCKGTYNKTTGKALYSKVERPFIVQYILDIHLSNNKGYLHWFTTLYAVLLTFLAVSSLWMFKPGSVSFKRGMKFTAAGFGISILVLFLK